MRRWAAAVCSSLMLLGPACGGGGNHQAGPSPPALRPRLEVAETGETFVDRTRTTEAHSSVPASDVRTLPTRIMAPAAGQPGRPYPLLVFAHGSGGLGTGYDVLLRTMAAAGYVVAAPALPIAGDDDEPGAWVADLPKLPGDVSFVIDEVLRLNADPGAPLYGSVDATHVGVAGHSMGAMTTLAVAGNTCCHDSRIKAAVVLAGRETPFGSGQFWARISTPVLLVHGDADTNVTYGDGRRAYADAPPPRFLLTILGGDHSSPYTGDPDDPQARLVTEATLDFLDQYLHGATDGVARMQTRAGPPGVAKLEQER